MHLKNVLNYTGKKNCSPKNVEFCKEGKQTGTSLEKILTNGNKHTKLSKKLASFRNNGTL